MPFSSILVIFHEFSLAKSIRNPFISSTRFFNWFGFEFSSSIRSNCSWPACVNFGKTRTRLLHILPLNEEILQRISKRYSLNGNSVFNTYYMCYVIYCKWYTRWSICPVPMVHSWRIVKIFWMFESILLLYAVIKYANISILFPIWDAICFLFSLFRHSSLSKKPGVSKTFMGIFSMP